MEGLHLDNTEFKYEFALDAIARKRCVLLLGPLFGHDSNGQLIHDLVKEKIFNEWQEKVDYRYENLFIFSEPETEAAEEALKKFALIGQLTDIYQKIEPHPVYDMIARMPFSVIVNCANDEFLEKAMDKTNIPYSMDYYSGDGHFKEDPQRKASDNKTSLCNVFGKQSEFHSFIVTYDMFFAFLSSIMSEDQSLPVHLSHKIAEAELFLLMGFDITKWYIPLLVYRLNRFGQNAKSSFHKRLGFINEIDMHNNDATIALRTFPLKIKMFDGSAIESIELLYSRLKAKGVLKRSNESLTPIINELQSSIQQEDLDMAFDLFFQRSINLNVGISQLTPLKGRFEDLKKRELDGTLTQEQINSERSKIRRGMIQLLEDSIRV